MKKGFTLAEILITLGIIGVVSAMTIPALNLQIKKKQTVAKFQKALAVINLAYKKSVDENGIPTSAFELGAENYFKTYWQPYMKTTGLCNTYKECGYSNNDPFKYLNGASVRAMVVDKNSRVSFLTNDGMFFIVYTANYGTDENGQYYAKPWDWILFDINGGKLPNVVGKDVFILTRENDEIKLPCYNCTTKAINDDCSPTGNGRSCAEKIVRDGWKIQKDYPF